MNRKEFAQLIVRMLLGCITILGLIVAMDDGRHGPPGILTTMAMTLLGAVLVRTYGELFRGEIESGKPSTWAECLSAFGNASVAAVPGLIPCAFLGACWLGFLSQPLALSLASWTLVLAMFAIGFGSRRLLGDRFGKSLRLGLEVAATGAALAAFNLWLRG